WLASLAAVSAAGLLGQRAVFVGRLVRRLGFRFLGQFAHAVRNPLRNGLRTREHRLSRRECVDLT
ncbi:MAG: hypothetical protein J0I06_23465, partial [Planctomycetes bacterium]|nr:hypothetical protein [Planctomycetota bacterium]